MPKVKTVEKQIWDLEGFDVRILHGDGRDVRGDRDGLPSYKYERAAKNDTTVSDWREQRFHQSYPGFRVAVYNADGNEATGQMQLGTVRDTYLDE